MKKEVLQGKVTEEAILNYKSGIITQGNTDLTLSKLLEKLLDKSIKSVDCPGNSAFKGYKGLKLNEYDNCYYLGNDDNPYIVLFMAKSTNIPSCEINSSTKVICARAFSCCTNLTSIVIPSGVTSIGHLAFASCVRLVEIYNISSLKIRKNKISNGHAGLYAKVIHTSLEEESQLIKKDNYLFIKDIKNKYHLVDYVGTETDLILPNNIEGKSYDINRDAFYKHSHITSIKIPSCVKTIGQGAFLRCSSLKSIDIPNGVISIGYFAFEKCSSLKSIVIPNNIISIGDDAFRGCSSLKYNEYDNGYYLGSSENPYLLFVKAKDTTIFSCAINDNTKFIASSAFRECSNLTELEIPNSVKSIGWLTFDNCSSLASINIPNSVTRIGESAFSECGSLKSITIPNSVTSIGSNAFYGCRRLTSIKIPSSVTSIGEFAFFECGSLASINIPNSVTSIGSNAFSGCSNLTSVTIGKSVKSIGSCVFSRCDSLKEVLFEGESIEWSRIDICGSNDKWISSIIYYYFETKPAENEKYWHYVDGVPTKW